MSEPLKRLRCALSNGSTLQSVGLVGGIYITGRACLWGRLIAYRVRSSTCAVLTGKSGGTRQCRANGSKTNSMAHTCDRLADLYAFHLQCIKDLDTFETRLETRTKESSMCASHWAFSQCTLIDLRRSNVSGWSTVWESLLSKTQRRN